MLRARIYLHGDKGDNIEHLIMSGLINDDVYHYDYHFGYRFDDLDRKIEPILSNYQTNILK